MFVSNKIDRNKVYTHTVFYNVFVYSFNEFHWLQTYENNYSVKFLKINTYIYDFRQVILILDLYVNSVKLFPLPLPATYTHTHKDKHTYICMSIKIITDKSPDKNAYKYR